MKRISELVWLNRNVIPETTNKMNVYKMKMKAQYNKAAKKTAYRVHDKVMFHDNTLVRDGQALSPKCMGLFTIKEKKNKDTYTSYKASSSLYHILTTPTN